MKVIKVIVLEYLSKIVEVKVDDTCDENDAIDIVQEDYRNGNIVLDANDFMGVDYEIYED